MPFTDTIFSILGEELGLIGTAFAWPCSPSSSGAVARLLLLPGSLRQPGRPGNSGLLGRQRHHARGRLRQILPDHGSALAIRLLRRHFLGRRPVRHGRPAQYLRAIPWNRSPNPGARIPRKWQMLAGARGQEPSWATRPRSRTRRRHEADAIRLLAPAFRRHRRIRNERIGRSARVLGIPRHRIGQPGGETMDPLKGPRHKGEAAIGAANLGEPNVVVYSSAVPDDNPEFVEARRRGIPVVKRAEMLGEALRGKYALAVAGTHGRPPPPPCWAESGCRPARNRPAGGGQPAAKTFPPWPAKGKSSSWRRTNSIVPSCPCVRLPPSSAISIPIIWIAYGTLDAIRDAFVDLRRNPCLLRPGGGQPATMRACAPSFPG